MTFGFEQARGANPMQIAVEVELEQGGGIIRWPAGVRATGLGRKPSECRSSESTKASRKRTGFSALT
jgi:hypothetical protein